MRKIKKKEEKNRFIQHSLLTLEGLDYDTINYIHNVRMLAKKTSSSHVWGGYQYVPPCSILEKIVEHFEKNTDIPLEIPFFVYLHILSGFLLQKEVEFTIGDQVKSPILWTILLAPSGAGKSYSIGEIRGLSEQFDNCIYDLAGVVSTAKFMEELQYNNNKLMVRDEFGEFYKQINTEHGHMKEMRDVLLRTYSSELIERRTKKEVITVEKPLLSMLGMTVTDSFLNIVSADDLINGFSQRFNYVTIEKDSTRHIGDYAIFPSIKITNKKLAVLCEKHLKSIKSSYRIAPSGLDFFKENFKYYAKDLVPDSFYRRIMWSVHSYAMLYHVMIDPTQETINEQSYAWAFRIVNNLHVLSLHRMLSQFGLTELDTKIKKSIFIIKELKEKENRECTPRDLMRRINGIRTAGEARAVLELAGKELKDI